MKIIRKDWKKYGGWFIGDFNPSAYRTSNFEVGFKIHPKGEKWPKHFHKKAIEINYILRGKMTIRNKKLKAGDIFIMDNMEVADPSFQEDCEIVCVKVPSIPGDKWMV